jgi:hypothetical protein
LKQVNDEDFEDGEDDEGHDDEEKYVNKTNNQDIFSTLSHFVED